MVTKEGRPVWFVDVETLPIDGVEAFIEPATAPSNYTKPEAIARYVFEAAQKAIEKAALDIDLGRIVVLGLKDGDHLATATLCGTEAGEKHELMAFWERWESTHPIRPMLVTFFGSQYDVPLLVRRSQYHGLTVPTMEMGRYRHPDVIDVAQYLTFDWHPAIKAHSLDFYATRFKIPHNSALKGSDVGKLAAEGKWDVIQEHCLDDLNATAALAMRLGLV